MSRLSDLPRDVPVPSHAYIPGRTPRHPEDWFDAIRRTVPDRAGSDVLAGSFALRCGRAYFDAGYYWECHEVLEAVWMQTSDPSPERDIVQALIQLANARLKLLMLRPHAARRLCDMVEAHLARCPSGQQPLGLDPRSLRAWVHETRAQSELHHNAK